MRSDMEKRCGGGLFTTVSVWRELSTKQSDHEDNDENTDTDDVTIAIYW